MQSDWPVLTNHEEEMLSTKHCCMIVRIWQPEFGSQSAFVRLVTL